MFKSSAHEYLHTLGTVSHFLYESMYYVSKLFSFKNKNKLVCVNHEPQILVGLLEPFKV